MTWCLASELHCRSEQKRSTRANGMVEHKRESLCWLLKIQSMVKYKKERFNLSSGLFRSIQNFLAEISDGFFQPDGQRHLRRPVQQTLRAANVRPPLLRVILRQRFENNFAARARTANDFPRKLQHAHL